jgi:hypothetical protein
LTKSKLFIAVLVALALAVTVVWITSIDRTVERAIEDYGSEALGTRVSVASVTIRLGRGEGTIRGLRIDQPDGFGPGAAASFDEITIDLGVDSLVSGDPYVVELARVAAPEVAYVVRKDGRSNLSVLQENLERYAGSGEVDEAPGGEPSDLRIRIDRLEIEGGQIEGDLTAAGLGRLTAKLPSMRGERLGGSRGAPPGEIAAIVGARFMAHTVSAVATSAIGRTLNDVVGEGTKAVRGLLDRLRGR